MTPARRFLIASLAFLTFVLGAYVGRIDERAKWNARCEEDMPCWDCETMGNRICGPAIGNAISQSNWDRETVAR